MPSISGNFGPAGILLQATVISTQDDIRALQQTGRLRLCSALVDTGANCTCIAPKVVQETGLLPIGKRDMVSASHVTPTNNYLFNLGLAAGLQQQPTGEISGSISFFEGINGMEFNPGPARFDILLGMDVLRRGCCRFLSTGTLAFAGR
jgi:hypothetical protein